MKPFDIILLRIVAILIILVIGVPSAILIIGFALGIRDNIRTIRMREKYADIAKSYQTKQNSNTEYPPDVPKFTRR